MSAIQKTLAGWLRKLADWIEPNRGGGQGEEG